MLHQNGLDLPMKRADVMQAGALGLTYRKGEPPISEPGDRDHALQASFLEAEMECQVSHSFRRAA
jgi:hypothetical protein